MKVFIVEDSAIMLKDLRSTLSEIYGITLIGHADDESSAIERIDALCPDVITLDLRLQSGSGFGVLQNIKKHHAEIKVVVLTNCSENAYVDRCMNAGADYFFDKSLQYMQFCEVLRGCACRFDSNTRRITEKLSAASRLIGSAVGNS